MTPDKLRLHKLDKYLELGYTTHILCVFNAWAESLHTFMRTLFILQSLYESIKVITFQNNKNVPISQAVFTINYIFYC